MYSRSKISKENKSRACANSVTHRKKAEVRGSNFIDNRPESIVQRKVPKESKTHDLVQTPLQRRVLKLGEMEDEPNLISFGELKNRTELSELSPFEWSMLKL